MAVPHTLSTEQILSLAPDAGSAKAAQGLLSPAKWSQLGMRAAGEAGSAALWGACAGSGASPYAVTVDLSGPAFTCSCPSRKFPCKHGLALMLLSRARGDLFAEGAPGLSEKGAAWLTGRQAKAEKAAAKAEAAPVPSHTLERGIGEDPVGAEAVAPGPNADALKRIAKRLARMQGGAEELSRWLSDRVREGLATLPGADENVFRGAAARLVDAQAPGLGERVTAIGAAVHTGPGWPERVLALMGQAQVLCDALARFETLPAPVQADVRVACGWPLDKESALGAGEAITDQWWVRGVAQSSDDRLHERRVWLQGAKSGRWALLLDFSHGMPRFEPAFIEGTCVAATLRYFDSASPLRALAEALPVQVDPAVTPNLSGAGVPVVPTRGWGPALNDTAAFQGANPFLTRTPVWVDAAVLRRDGQYQGVDAEGTAVSLNLDDDQGFAVLAASGGVPVRLYGEWESGAMRPLSAELEGVCFAFGGQAAAAGWLAPPAAGGPWTAWVGRALLGVDRPAPPLPAALGEVGGLLDDIQTISTASEALACLRAAGALSLCGIAAAPLARLDGEMPEPAALEPAPRADTSRWMQLLGEVLEDGPDAVVRTACARLKALGAVLPHGRLVAALVRARKTPAIAGDLAAVLGSRGRWLATLHPAGRGLSGEVDDSAVLGDQAWSEAPLERRRLSLRAQRATDPEGARARLAVVMAKEGAKERAALLPTLAVGLSLDDEPLVSAAQKDRGGEVRAAALTLALSLPGGPLGQRMAERLRACVHPPDAEHATWWIEPPLEPDPAWPGDYATQTVSHLTGRAAVLYDLVRGAPLDTWNAITGQSASEILTWLKAGEWWTAVSRGVCAGHMLRAEGQWPEALMEAQVPVSPHHWAELATRISAADLDAWLCRRVLAATAQVPDAPAFDSMLSIYRHTLLGLGRVPSDTLAQALVTGLAAWLARDQNAALALLGHHLEALAETLPEALLPALIAALSIPKIAVARVRADKRSEIARIVAATKGRRDIDASAELINRMAAWRNQLARQLSGPVRTVDLRLMLNALSLEDSENIEQLAHDVFAVMGEHIEFGQGAD